MTPALVHSPWDCRIYLLLRTFAMIVHSELDWSAAIPPHFTPYHEMAFHMLGPRHVV